MRTHPSQRRAAFGLQDDDVGAPERELATAVRGGDAAGEFEDADARERRPRLRSGHLPIVSENVAVGRDDPRA